jgi:hypothetical protein
MTRNSKVTVSGDLPKHRPSATERRAAMTAAIATKQQDLKREAAERRAQRAQRDSRTP